MDDLSRDDLLTLLKPLPGTGLSLFMPTHRKGAETRQDPIRLKNLLRQAEQALVERGMRGTEARDLLAPAQNMVDDALFWQYQGDGLAIFAAKDTFLSYRLPIRLEEMVMAGDRFHFKPLVPLLGEDGRFRILAVSKNQVRLLEAGRFGATEVPLRDAPESLADATKYDDLEKENLQFHTGTASPGGGRRAAVFHGTGEMSDIEKENLLRYFRLIDRGVRTSVPDQRTPLVLAGVDYLHPLYREANTYAGLLDDGVTGNPDQMSAEQLHLVAWEVVKPHWESKRKAAEEKFRSRLGTGVASSQLPEIVAGAHHGRVEALFVDPTAARWGRYEPQTGELLEHASREPGDDDLLDLATVHAYLSGADIYPMEPGTVPDGQDVSLAAVFRY